MAAYISDDVKAKGTGGLTSRRSTLGHNCQGDPGHRYQTIEHMGR